MWIRAAAKSDFKLIDELYRNGDFTLDIGHLEQILIAEDDNGIVAVGLLNTLLEVSFLTVPNRARKSRVLALTALLQQVNIETQKLGYTSVHAFVTNDKMLHILKEKFKFIKSKALQVLVKWAEE